MLSCLKENKMSLFENDFTVKIDTSACRSIITGHDSSIDDTWYYSDQIFENGKIYGIISERQQGNMYLSYLLGGRIEFGDVRIFCNDREISQKDLNESGWNLEPYSERYGRMQVRKSIEQALKTHDIEDTFESIAERFLLTSKRYDLKLKSLSGERWPASAALGYAMGKRIFYAPYMPSSFYYQMCDRGLLKALRELTGHGALVVLPVGSDVFIKHIADELIYTDRKYDIEALKEKYGKFDESWVR